MASPTTASAQTNGNKAKARKPRDQSSPLSAEEFLARARKYREAERALLKRVPAPDQALALQLLETVDKARRPETQPSY